MVRNRRGAVRHNVRANRAELWSQDSKGPMCRRQLFVDSGLTATDGSASMWLAAGIWGLGAASTGERAGCMLPDKARDAVRQPSLRLLCARWAVQKPVWSSHMGARKNPAVGTVGFLGV